ncbi:MAG: hypothetical protein AAF629_35210, partial [Chloroflexota bacterium]
MYKLEPSAYASVQNLFQPWDYHVGPEAVISGNSPGEIYVDDVKHPTVALLATIEHYFLAGRDDQAQFNKALKQFLVEIVTKSREQFPDNGSSLHIVVHPETW